MYSSFRNLVHWIKVTKLTAKCDKVIFRTVLGLFLTMANVKLFQIAAAKTCLCILQCVTKILLQMRQMFGGFNFKLNWLFQTMTNFILKYNWYFNVLTTQRYTLGSFSIVEIFSCSDT